MLIIGLTGGIGSGKSLVSDYLHSQGITIVDADVLAREPVKRGGAALHKIAAHFGQDMLLDDGELNRALLRQRIFADPQEKLWLEALLHPLVRTLIREALANAEGPYCVLSSPLLLETGQDALVDRVVVVDVPEALQRKRASQRDGVSSEDIERIMRNQYSRAQRLESADDIIDNSGSVAATHTQIAALHETYLSLSQSHPPIRND